MNLLIVALFACPPNGHRGCLYEDLGAWCLHAGSEGPDLTDERECQAPAFVASADAKRCGELDIITTSGGLSATTMYFDHATGELVAVRYTADVNLSCGGLHSWYGERIFDWELDCCSYDVDSADLPACEQAGG